MCRGCQDAHRAILRGDVVGGRALRFAARRPRLAGGAAAGEAHVLLAQEGGEALRVVAHVGVGRAGLAVAHDRCRKRRIEAAYATELRAIDGVADLLEGYGLAAVVAMARLNAGTNSMGTGMELTVIAAAVIGGVSLAGGSGSVAGTGLGALIIQSIDSGLLLTDVSIGWRMVVLGQVLVAAVVFDRVVQK